MPGTARDTRPPETGAQPKRTPDRLPAHAKTLRHAQGPTLEGK